MKSILVKYATNCANCGHKLPKHTPAYYDRPKMYCATCHEREADSVRSYIDAQERAAVERINLNMNPHA